MVVKDSDKVFRKGLDKGIDSYSGYFYFNNEVNIAFFRFGTYPEDTGLCNYLKEEGISTVYCVGLAFDYCVGSTARDAAKNGFKSILLTKFTRGIS